MKRAGVNIPRAELEDALRAHHIWKEEIYIQPLLSSVIKLIDAPIDTVKEAYDDACERLCALDTRIKTQKRIHVRQHADMIDRQTKCLALQQGGGGGDVEKVFEDLRVAHMNKITRMEYDALAKGACEYPCRAQSLNIIKILKSQGDTYDHIININTKHVAARQKQAALLLQTADELKQQWEGPMCEDNISSGDTVDTHTHTHTHTHRWGYDD
eukprot:GHVR01082285.1.p1 GENE.GHVR01082285.1~~GHVR01082285.1.p1  ORF type:complete len:213 (-),score=91.92 GHVR01082285.1:181-819(-)